jgi:hypothetical protein
MGFKTMGATAMGGTDRPAITALPLLGKSRACPCSRILAGFLHSSEW